MKKGQDRRIDYLYSHPCPTPRSKSAFTVAWYIAMRLCSRRSNGAFLPSKTNQYIEMPTKSY